MLIKLPWGEYVDPTEIAAVDFNNDEKERVRIILKSGTHTYSLPGWTLDIDEVATLINQSLIGQGQ